MYNFNNKNDRQLEELATAIKSEQLRRFKAKWWEFPKLEGLGDWNSVNATKAYRDKYKVSIIQAHWLFRRDYRN